MLTQGVGSYFLIVIDNLSRRVCVQIRTIKMTCLTISRNGIPVYEIK